MATDPLEAKATYDRVYQGSFYHGRSRTLVQALSAVHMALYYLAWKQMGVTVYKLLGSARTQHIRPYVTLYPGDIYDDSVQTILAETRRQAERAVDQGLRAVKVPVLFGAENDPGGVSDRTIVGFIEDCREMLDEIAPDLVLAADFGYCWWDWQAAAWRLKRLEDYDVYFAEAPLRHDDLRGTRGWRLYRRSELEKRSSQLAAGRCANGSNGALCPWSSQASAGRVASPN
ncbi:MAG: hypothetical protein HOH36_08360 [Acidimicrobiaceae bacterium]|nr:hypothetical protein [Acidimicrobiaceae bacterium]MBT5850431.1 hypothetical protein [Acidimicrobiaceae bacterium]